MFEEFNKPSYYSIIPANVRYDKDITPNAKLLYAEITSLCNLNGLCYASNKYFCLLYNASRRSIQNWIKELTNKSYIKIVFDKNNKRLISILPCYEKIENNVSSNSDIKNKAFEDYLKKVGFSR